MQMVNNITKMPMCPLHVDFDILREWWKKPSTTELQNHHSKAKAKATVYQEYAPIMTSHALTGISYHIQMFLRHKNISQGRYLLGEWTMDRASDSYNSQSRYSV